MARQRPRTARRKSQPPARDGEARAQAILEAALDLFANRDYTAVTMKDIAQAAGMTYSLTYYYYKNKQQIFHAAIHNSIAQTIAHYNKIKGQHDHPVDLINDWFNNNVQRSVPLRKLVKILFDYSGPNVKSPSVKSAIRRFYETEVEILSDSIRDGIARGIFAPTDPDRLARFVSTHIDGIFFVSMFRDEEDLASAMAELKRVLWQCLGYTPPAARTARKPRRKASARRRSAPGG